MREESKQTTVGHILNVPVHAVCYADVLDQVREWIVNNSRTGKYIVQANVFTLVNAKENPHYIRAVREANLLVPDGMPLVWLLRHKGHALHERVYGPDLMMKICEEAAKNRWRCFFYGGNEETVRLLENQLLKNYPSLIIAGTYAPPFRALTDKEDDEVCRYINSKKPDILWVALGSPRQDLWMYEHRDKLNVSVMHGVGAAFDFLSGKVPQAPRWMMRAGLEWLFRLFIEPRRLWKRYTITNLKFLYYLCTSALYRSQEDME
jgi:N-acetylglucosaminyldiphosphoundecaprenol N-acetyl-beta-D-mannosaminyltransferase